MNAGGLFEHIGQEVEVNALGKTWRLGRLDLGVWDAFFAWGKTVLPNPAEVAHAQVVKLQKEEFALTKRLAALAPAPDGTAPAAVGTDEDPEYLRFLLKNNAGEQEFITREGITKASTYLSFGSPEAQSLIGSIRGLSRLFWLLMRKHRPDATEEDAYGVVMELGKANAEGVLDLAGGKVPPGPKGPRSAPAAPASN